MPISELSFLVSMLLGVILASFRCRTNIPARDPKYPQFIIFFIFIVLGIDSKALHMLGRLHIPNYTPGPTLVF